MRRPNHRVAAAALAAAALLAPALPGGTAGTAAAGEVQNSLADSGAVPAPSKSPPANAATPLSPSAAADETGSEPSSRAANEKAARDVMDNERLARVIASQVAVAKAKADLEKAKADEKKAISDGKGAASPPSGPSPQPGDGGGAGADIASAAPPTPPSAPANTSTPFPGMSVTYVAGSTGRMEAGLRIARFGSILVREGSRIPTTDNMSVKSISENGVLVVDRSGKVYPVSFANGTGR